MYGIYSYVIGGILIFMYGIHICNVGPKEFLTDFSQKGIWIPAKEGVEEVNCHWEVPLKQENSLKIIFLKHKF